MAIEYPLNEIFEYVVGYIECVCHPSMLFAEHQCLEAQCFILCDWSRLGLERNKNYRFPCEVFQKDLIHH